MDIAQLADRAAAGTESLAQLGARIARGVAIAGLLGTGLCVLLAVAGLEGGGRTVALVLTAMAAVFGVGAPALAWWRLRSARGRYQALAGEFRQLFDTDEVARREIVDTVVHGEAADAPSIRVTPRGAGQFGGVRTLSLERLRGFVALTDAFTALARFPALLVFAALGVLALGGLTLVIGLAGLL